MNNPLFLCGPACCGTNLVKAILGVHPEINLESEPYLPIFRSLRNAIVSGSNNSVLQSFNPKLPLSEYYFFDEKLAIMDLIQSSNLEIEFNPQEFNQLKSDIADRCEYVPHLIQYLDTLKGSNYKELFISALNILSLASNNKEFKWSGWLDSWIEEFFPLLAKEFPKARFVLIFRDPRAAIASYKRSFSKIESKLEPLTLSYLRCWRKQVAFTEHFQGMGLFNNRLFIVRYEDMIENPERETRRLCDFLEVDFLPKMLDTNNFKGLGKNTNKWEPRLHWVDVPEKGIYKDSRDRWKNELPNDLVNFIEFIVGQDADHLGYTPTKSIDNYNQFNWSAYKLHKEEHLKCKGWRTDNENPDIDLSLEILRHECLNYKTNDSNLIRRCFLYPEIYENLLKHKRMFA